MKRKEHRYETTDVVADRFVCLARRSPTSAASVNKKTIGRNGMTAYVPASKIRFGKIAIVATALPTRTRWCWTSQTAPSEASSATTSDVLSQARAAGLSPATY